jgi:four helix bundle protein
MELETYVMIAQRLGYIPAQQTATTLDEIAEISRMLRSLRRRLLDEP